MPPGPELPELAFVFRSVASAREALQRLQRAGVALAHAKLFPPCVLIVRVQAAHDEARICELARGRGRLVPVSQVGIPEAKPFNPRQPGT